MMIVFTSHGDLELVHFDWLLTDKTNEDVIIQCGFAEYCDEQNNVICQW